MREDLSLLGVAPGHRNLMRRISAVAAVATSKKLMSLVEAATGAKAFPIRSIYFDKSPASNWLVPWHQDLSIATRCQVGLPGYETWSRKDGVPHVQPPVEVLEAMATVRLHLDDCDESNGALRVIPASHRQGRLAASRISEIRSREVDVLCLARAGDVLLMRPLLLHSSNRSLSPSRRRVVHLEYTSYRLPGELQWAEGIFDG